MAGTALLAALFLFAPALAKDIKPLVVVGDQDYAPFEYKDENGKAQGICVDIWALWSRRTGVPVDYRMMDWRQALFMVRSGQADAVGAIFLGAKREADFDFSVPYARTPTHLFFQENIYGLRGPQDLSGFRVGVILEDIAEAYMAKNWPRLDLLAYPSYPDMVEAAVKGQIRVFVADTPVALFHLARLGKDTEFHTTREPLYVSDMRAAVRKGNRETLELINRGMSAISKEELDQVISAWQGLDLFPRMPWNALALLLALLLASGLAVILWNRQLRRKVDSAVSGLEEKQAQLRDSEEKYRLLVNNVSDMVLKLDVDGRVLFASPSALQTFQLTEEAVLGNNILDHLAEEKRRAAQKALEGVKKKPHRRELEMELNTSTGDKWVSWLVTAMASPEEDVAAILAVGRDITRRRRVQEEVFRAYTLLTSLIDSLPDLVFYKTPEGVHQMVNKAYREFLGKEDNLLMGSTNADLYPPELAKVMDEEDRLVMREGETVFKELWLVDSQGRDRLFEIVKSPYRGVDGQMLGLIGVGRDITARRQAAEEKARLEAELLHSRKMEAVGTLASGIAHDFNNILQAITGYVDLMINRPGQSGENQENLKEVDLAVRQATALVQQLLTFSRKVEPHLIRVDLNGAIMDCLNILGRTIPRMVKIETRLEPGLWPVHGDPTQLKQVLLNMVKNAADAMPGGGAVTITSRNLPHYTGPCGLGASGSGRPFVEMKIADTGVGMDPETLRHVFDPFFTTKEVGKGTGLGLATVYGIVKTHLGHIHCESSPGTGTIFTVSLPALEEEAGVETPRPVDSNPELPRGKETILLVDDERAIREVGSQMLSHQGYRVITADSGEAAVETYQRTAFGADLVIMDLGMPGMGGKRCLIHLKELNPQVRVLITSGYAPDAEVEECLKAGAADYLAKPYRLEEIVNRVREVLDR